MAGSRGATGVKLPPIIPRAVTTSAFDLSSSLVVYSCSKPQSSSPRVVQRSRSAAVVATSGKNLDILQSSTARDVSNRGLSSWSPDSSSSFLNVRVLDLSRNDFSRLDSLRLSGLRSLTVLNLSFNRISSLEGLCDECASRLEVLDVNHNEGLISLGDISSKIPRLRKLNVGFCGLESINGAELPGSLEELWARHNKISFTECMGGLRALRVLLLDGNRVCTFTAVGSLFGPRGTLCELGLGGNQVSTSRCYRGFLQMQIPSLRVLDRVALSPLDAQLSDQLSVEPQFLAPLSRALPSDDSPGKRLSSLSLCGTEWTRQLPHGLLTSGDVREVTLSQCPLRNVGVVPSLKESSSVLRVYISKCEDLAILRDVEDLVERVLPRSLVELCVSRCPVLRVSGWRLYLLYHLSLRGIRPSRLNGHEIAEFEWSLCSEWCGPTEDLIRSIDWPRNRVRLPSPEAFVSARHCVLWAIQVAETRARRRRTFEAAWSAEMESLVRETLQELQDPSLVPIRYPEFLS